MKSHIADLGWQITSRASRQPEVARRGDFRGAYSKGGPLGLVDVEGLERGAEALVHEITVVIAVCLGHLPRLCRVLPGEVYLHHLHT